MKGGAGEREGKEDSTAVSSNRTKTRLYPPAQIPSLFFIQMLLRFEKGVLDILVTGFFLLVCSQI